MDPIDTHVRILSNCKIDLTFQDLEKKIQTSGNSSGILETAREILKNIQGKWEPAALFQWFEFEIDKKRSLGRIIQQSGDTIHLDLGQSIKFLEQAAYVMVSSYTIGQALDAESAKASSEGSMLEAYMVDLIGLAALEKTADIVKKTAETSAKQFGWGVSPFLSPGSVHGWNLEEQTTLCSLLPIEKINVTISNDAVLFPLKSIVAVIGIGPGYDSRKVGSTCDVCSKRNSCEMKQTH
jgi:hypothetical protein